MGIAKELNKSRENKLAMYKYVLRLQSDRHQNRLMQGNCREDGLVVLEARHRLRLSASVYLQSNVKTKEKVLVLCQKLIRQTV
jgi:hypothetical protein